MYWFPRGISVYAFNACYLWFTWTLFKGFKALLSIGVWPSSGLSQAPSSSLKATTALRIWSIEEEEEARMKYKATENTCTSFSAEVLRLISSELH